jgi:hypothetical protein
MIIFTIGSDPEPDQDPDPGPDHEPESQHYF